MTVSHLARLSSWSCRNRTSPRLPTSFALTCQTGRSHAERTCVTHLTPKMCCCGIVGNSGRSERIRTSDPLLPKQVRYQTALRSDRGAGVTLSRHTLQEGAAHQFGAAAVLLRVRMNKPAAMIMLMPTIIIGVIASSNKSQPRIAAQMICEYCIGATMIAGALR